MVAGINVGRSLMPVTQEFLINLSAFWLAVIIGWQIIVFLSGERKGEK